MLFLIHTHPNTAVKSSVYHLFISYDALCIATASWSKGINFGVKSLVSNISPFPLGIPVCVLVTHNRACAGNQHYFCYHTPLWNSERWTGSVIVLSCDVICFTAPTRIKNGSQLQRAPGLCRVSRLGCCDGWGDRCARNASVCHFLVCWGKNPGKRQLGRPRREWEDVSLDLREVSWLVMVQDHVQWREFGISGVEHLDLMCGWPCIVIQCG